MQTSGLKNATIYRRQSLKRTGYEEGHKEHTEITVNTNEESNSLKPCEDPEKSLLRQGHSMKNSVSVLKRIGSTVTTTVASLASLTPETKPTRRRLKSSTELALNGLKFITKADGVAGWPRVEKDFDRITETTGGSLDRSDFGDCIGKHKLKLKHLMWLDKFPFGFGELLLQGSSQKSSQKHCSTP